MIFYFTVFFYNLIITEDNLRLAMIKKYIIMILLISIASSLNCAYLTPSSCTSAGCNWNNNTCTVGSGTCLAGSVYQNSTQECVECAALDSTNCSSICTSFYYSSINNICHSCTNLNPNCLQCSSSQCSSCATGFSVNPNYPTECLISQCMIRFCTQCIDSSSCYSCSTGYTPSTNGTFCSLAICSISNCLSCYNSSSCVACITGYQLSSDSLTCTLICKDPFCASCLTPALCVSCLGGYSYDVKAGYCKLMCLLPNCNTCDLSMTCTSCANGYTVDETSYRKCNANCVNITNCATCSDPNTCT